MSRGRFVFDQKLGKFVDGKAGPELLPEHMRALPGELTTKEIAEGEKIHEYDPPHIVKGIIEEHHKSQRSSNAASLPEAVENIAKSIAPVGDIVPLNQARIDLVRFRVIRSRITRLLQSPDPEKALTDTLVDYVFFPENNVNKYQLRAKSARPGIQALPHPLPKHLRNFRLELDIFNWPESILDALKAAGHPPPDIREMIDAAKRHSSITQEIQREESMLWTPGDTH